MIDPQQTINALWQVAAEAGYTRDGVSDEGRNGDRKVLIGYGSGAVRVRMYLGGRKTGHIDVTDEEGVDRVRVALQALGAGQAREGRQ